MQSDLRLISGLRQKTAENNTEGLRGNRFLKSQSQLIFRFRRHLPFLCQRRGLRRSQRPVENAEIANSECAVRFFSDLHLFRLLRGIVNDVPPRMEIILRRMRF